MFLIIKYNIETKLTHACADAKRGDAIGMPIFEDRQRPPYLFVARSGFGTGLEPLIYPGICSFVEFYRSDEDTVADVKRSQNLTLSIRWGAPPRPRLV